MNLSTLTVDNMPAPTLCFRSREWHGFWDGTDRIRFHRGNPISEYVNKDGAIFPTGENEEDGWPLSRCINAVADRHWIVVPDRPLDLNINAWPFVPRTLRRKTLPKYPTIRLTQEMIDTYTGADIVVDYLNYFYDTQTNWRRSETGAITDGRTIYPNPLWSDRAGNFATPGVYRMYPRRNTSR